MTVVTVTYGARTDVLNQAIQAVGALSNVHEIIVVCNGSRPGPDDLVSPSEAGLVVHLSEENEGTAAGFRRGIGLALERGAETILLLDDDNIVSRDAACRLLQLSELLGPQPHAISCLRTARRDYVDFLSGKSRALVRRNSFLGFHLKDLPSKLLSRLSRGRREPRIPAAERLRAVEVAPYGGLFLNRQALALAVLPDEGFVLYGDDHDFVIRLRMKGAPVYLTDIVTIEDADRSWNNGRSLPWADASAPAWRVYYALRNRMLVERRFFTSNKVIYLANIAAYMTIIMAYRIFSFKTELLSGRSLRPIWDGVKDGYRSRSGRRAEYPLPR